ncbi:MULTISPECIES: hypothetical protein [unclassified Microbacterium]|uniref:hypothetical protein n=1 Tax=unclassified Microbacterium TaxID=2609290 RepID=UPI000C2CA387|nr:MULTISPECIES: hypothetical protein [unclassified Microbacterium]
MSTCEASFDKKYRDYTTRIARDATTAAHYVTVDGAAARLHYFIYRVPSRKEFVLRHMAGSTPAERESAERVLALMPDGRWARYRPKCWFKYRTPAGHYCWRVSLGRFLDDPVVQLELEMMIDRYADDLAQRLWEVGSS